jgi:hypothetical protein
MTEKQPDAYERLNTEGVEGLRRSRIGTTEQPGVFALEFIDIAKEQGGFLPTATAVAYAGSKAGKYDVNGLHKKKQITARQWFEKLVTKDPSIIGLAPGSEAEEMDKRSVQAAMVENNATEMSRLIHKHGVVKVNSLARQYGKKDWLDKKPGVAPTVRREGETEKTSNANANTTGNPWSPATFNLTAQGKLWIADPTRAKKLMAEAGALKLGATEKEIRGAR